MPTLTWEDLNELGFVFNSKTEEWEKPFKGGRVMVNLIHNDSAVYVGDPSEPYAPMFNGVRTRADLETLIRLLGEQK